jgi:hypothetical protein
MSKYDRDHFEQWCEENNIETGRTVCVFEAWAKLQEQRDAAMQALKELKEGTSLYASALESNHDFDVIEWAIKHESILDKVEANNG